MALGFCLVWGPPALAAFLLCALPFVNSEIAAYYFAKNGVGAWTASRSGIEDTLKKTGFTWLVALAASALLGLWLGFNGYERLSLGSASGDKTLEGFFVDDDDRARLARVFFTAAPWAVIVYYLGKWARFCVVRRIERIAGYLSGSDKNSAELRLLDEDITARYREFGSRSAGTHAADYQKWVGANVRAVIRSLAAAEAEFNVRRAAALAELKELTSSLAQFEATKTDYQSGLARLRKTTSVALLASLEDAGRTLVAEPFIQLIDAKRWDDVRSFLSEVRSELGRIDAMADEWTDSHEEAREPSRSMTLERALRILALPRDCRREDVERRRKELAKIYHPDRAGMDTDFRARNHETMQEINEASDFLLAAKV